jgi:hypothetical protein
MFAARSNSNGIRNEYGTNTCRNIHHYKTGTLGTYSSAGVAFALIKKN